MIIAREIKESTQKVMTESERQELIVRVDMVLRQYCLGRSPVEVGTNRRKLTAFLGILNGDKIEIGKLMHADHFALHLLLDELTQITTKKAQKLGFVDIEELLRFSTKLDERKVDEAKIIARVAEQRLQKALPQWTFDVLADWEKQKDTDLRKALHIKVVNTLLAEYASESRLSISSSVEPSYVFFAGIPGAGKSSAEGLASQTTQKTINADIDLIRPILFKILEESENALFQADSYNDGVYDDTDQAMIRALNPEAKVIMEKLVFTALQRGISVKSHGTLKSKSKIESQSRYALQNKFRYEVVHVWTEPSVSWNRNLNRSRSVPATKTVDAISGNHEVVRMVRTMKEGRVVANYPDRIQIIDNSSSVPKVVFAAVKGLFNKMDIIIEDTTFVAKILQKDIIS